jgi:DNA-binding SARP family transcriptional activator
MERRDVAGGRQDVTALAEKLIRQGEGWAAAGELRQAAAVLAEAWTIGVERDLTLTNRAAWQVAWVLVQMGAYHEASVWFGRVAAPPSNVAGHWPAARKELVELFAERPDAVGERGDGGRQATAEPPTVPLPVLEVTSLGRFRIVRDGQLLPPCRSTKAVAILRFLLTRPDRAASKEELMELLWPDSAPRDAAHSMHVAISGLRRHIDPAATGLLLYEAGQYLINPRAFVVDDCERFRWLSADGDAAWRAGDLPAAQRAYVEALACYRDDYAVHEQDLAWSVPERERLLARYLAVLDHLGVVYIAQGLFEPALECYDRVLTRDAYREDAHSQVMRCFARLGRRSEALRQYERCAAILAAELGVEPLPETRALYQTLRAGGAPPEA